MSGRKILHSTKDMVKKVEVDPDEKNEVQEWIETILGLKFENDLFYELKNGVILCELLNKIKPNTCKKYKVTKIAFVCRANIQIYLKGCQNLGIPPIDCFDTNDLFDGMNLNRVIRNLYSLSAISRKYNFEGPFIGKLKYAQKNKRIFSQEILNKSKSSVPIWNKGGNIINTKYMDKHGIVKTDKNMQSHSNVPSTWEKGSNQLKNKSMDAYGIIKADKDMQKHTNVPSVWEKGAHTLKTSPAMDGYGIIKADKDMQQHTNVPSTWEKGANQMKTKSMDAYGIIKAEKDMQSHSNVSSVWEKGSNQLKTGSNMDGYGIVKTNKEMQQHTNVPSTWEKGANELRTKSMDAYGIIKAEKDMQQHTNVSSVWEKGSNEVNVSSNMDSHGIVLSPENESQNDNQTKDDQWVNIDVEDEDDINDKTNE